MSPPTFFRDYILLIFAYILLITCITPRAGIIRRKSCVFFLQEIYRLHTTLDYWDYSDWYVRVLAVKASHKWEPSSNGRVGSVPTYECSHQWPLSHLSSLFIRMQMAHLEQKLDGLPGRINEPQRRGWVFESDRHVMRYHSAPSLSHKQREGEGCLQKKGKKTSKGICADPQKSSRSMKIIRSLLVVGQLYFHTNTFCFIFHF